jgi:hypothetical protein
LSALFLSAADDYALDALAGSGEPLVADVVTIALPRGAALDLEGPLGNVLRAARPRLNIICDSPAPAPQGLNAIIAARGPSGSQAAAALGAPVYRLSATGSVSLSGGAQGWTLG